jgi:chromosome segregation ATPase
MASDISTSNARGEEMKRRLSETEFRKGQLEGEVKLLQQSLTAVTSVGEAGSSESALLALRSTTSAQIRQLSAEIEFLKAQLASENQCKEELVQSLARANEANSSAKAEWKKILSEQDEQRKKELAAYETKLQEDLAAPKKEIARLEALTAELRQEMLDVKGALSLSQTKVEEEKTAALKYQETCDKLNAEIKSSGENLSSANEKLNHLQKTITTEAAIKSNLESSLRRLANEVRYSRTQFESERQCKLELEQAMAECERR